MGIKAKYCLIFIVILSLNVSACSQFQDVFSGAKTSQHLKKKKKSKTKVTQADTEGLRKPIVTKKGTYYFVAPQDNLSTIAKRYKIKREELAQVNDLLDSKLIIGRRLFIPNKKTKKQYVTISNIIDNKKSRSKSRKKVKFDWPVKKFVLTSKFGPRRGRPHDGIDLSAKRGTPIYAAASGKVIYSKRFSSYGNLVVIKHAGNYFTAYAHATKLYVKQGTKVKKGQKIASVGRTGRSSGPHLHFEIHKGTRAIDPIKILPDKKYVTWKKKRK